MAIIDVVKYNGTPDVFAWKYPNEELSTWTQLIVNESQEAVLYRGGQALDTFQSGRHTLDTANIPILNHIINLPFGGRSPFTAEIWYINKAYSLDVKWGTASPIQIQDPKYKVFIPIRSFGQFGIKIEDSKKFLTKLVGTLPVFDKTNLVKYFRGLYLTRVKDCISSYLIHNHISVLEINAYLDEISDELEKKLIPTLEMYGIRLVSFYVNDINVPEEDSAVKQLKAALAKRAEMDIVGYSYQQERSFDTLEGAATNPNSIQGGLVGAGIGLGMGAGVGGAAAAQFGGLMQNITTTDTKTCPNCQMTMEKNVRFCSSCGFDTSKVTEEVTKCHACGAVLNSKVKFCPECGAAQAKFCPECGKPVSGNAKFCPECGTKL